ncbi:DUF881 domain-containing protein [Plantactinospora sp. KBS50]|uniref:DUF881 domain-containing protein n=1 Tax=Plantactinospora sp. KBS50 TaxID=2024580 RepID=UPI001E4E451D|nr:DUF881 domain-containing protein [Plantactinospora sp. KBS50]
MVLVLVGFLFAVAYRQTLADEPGRAKARAGLVSQIKEREADNDRLSAKADTLRQEVAALRDAAVGGQEAARLRDLEAATGLGRVRGDGAVVRVSDAPAKSDAVTGARTPNLGRVLDRDLQDIANALWAVGAEAVSINGQRLTATSTIRAAGGNILVDFRPVSGPYEVSAVGPARMSDRFSRTAAAATMRAVSSRYGMGFDVKDAEDLELPAANEPQLRYATPPADSSATPTVRSSSTQTPVPLLPPLLEAADDRCPGADRRRVAGCGVRADGARGVAALPADRGDRGVGRRVRRGTRETGPDLR